MVTFATLMLILGLLGWLRRLGLRADARAAGLTVAQAYGVQPPARVVVRRMWSELRADAHRGDPVTAAVVAVALLGSIVVAAVFGGWQAALIEAVAVSVCAGLPAYFALAARREVRQAMAASAFADEAELFVPQVWVKKYRSATDT